MDIIKVMDKDTIKVMAQIDMTIDMTTDMITDMTEVTVMIKDMVNTTCEENLHH